MTRLQQHGRKPNERYVWEKPGARNLWFRMAVPRQYRSVVGKANVYAEEILVPWLAIHYSWRAAFVVVSSTGLVWVVVWRFIYPRSLDQQAADQNRVKAAGASVRALLKHRQTWGLILLPRLF